MELRLPTGMKITLSREEEAARRLAVREMHLYSEKVDEEDMRAFFEQLVKARLPLFGFLDFSGVLSLNAFRLIVRRKNNTVKFYIREKKGLQDMAALVFPFRFAELGEMEQVKGKAAVLSKFYKINGGAYGFLDFMLKENVEELAMDLSKVLGGFVAAGDAIDEKGRKRSVLVTDPEKFFRINLEENSSIYIEVLDPIPKRIHTSSRFPVFEESGVTMGVDNYDPMQHTLVAGTSGSGKTKALYVLLKAIEAKYKDGARIIVIDPHGEFTKTFKGTKMVDFVKNYIEPLDVGGQKTPMLTQLISQLIASSIGQENKYSERVLFYAVHLLSSIDKLDLMNVSALLTDATAKAEFVSMCDNEEVKRFFDEEYNDIYIHHFNSAILPILNFIGEYQLYLGKEKKLERLAELLEKNRITVVSFDPHFFGRRMISFLAGAIINQMYILAITGKLMDKPTILVVDEFPRVETRVTRDILSETRKFNLYAYLSCQYLGQLSKEVLDGIVSNTRNLIAFKLNRQDAAMLSSVMEIKLEEYFKKHRAQAELEESKKEMFIRLNQRECIVRLYDGRNYMLPMKMRIVDMKSWGLHEPTKDEGEGQAQGKGAGPEEKPPSDKKPGFPDPMIDEPGEKIDVDADKPRKLAYDARKDIFGNYHAMR
ncbi:MAG: DUF87 domain-containing protein [Candidatus Micrarchaeota archaeon]